MELTVSMLRNILENALDQLEGYNDSDVVSAKTNTHFVDMPFIGTRYGYIDLNDIEVEEYWDEDEELWDPNVDESRKRRSFKNSKLENRINRLERLTRKYK